MGLMAFFKLPLPMTDLIHGKVHLRFPAERDFQEWADLRTQSRDHTKEFEPDIPQDELSKKAWLRRLRSFSVAWRQDRAKLFYIFDAADEHLVGVITLSNIRRGPAHMGTIGYWVGKPFLRQHYARDAVNCVLDFAFGPMGLERVEAACLPHNVASRGVLLKCGFAWEGYAKSYLHINGKRRDHVLFGLTRQDYEVRRRG